VAEYHHIWSTKRISLIFCEYQWLSSVIDIGHLLSNARIDRRKLPIVSWNWWRFPLPRRSVSEWQTVGAAIVSWMEGLTKEGVSKIRMVSSHQQCVFNSLRTEVFWEKKKKSENAFPPKTVESKNKWTVVPSESAIVLSSFPVNGLSVCFDNLNSCVRPWWQKSALQCSPYGDKATKMNRGCYILVSEAFINWGKLWIQQQPETTDFGKFLRTYCIIHVVRFEWFTWYLS
jgi:hypothetical protein